MQVPKLHCPGPHEPPNAAAGPSRQGPASWAASASPSGPPSPAPVNTLEGLMKQGAALLQIPAQDRVTLAAQKERRAFVQGAQAQVAAQGQAHASLGALQGLLARVHAHFGDRKDAIDALRGAIALGEDTPDNLSLLGQNLGVALAHDELEPEQAARTLAELDLNAAHRRELLLKCVESSATADSSLRHGFVPALRMAEATFARSQSAPERGEVRALLQAAFCAQGRSRWARREVQQQLPPTLSQHEAALYGQWLDEAARADRRQNLKALTSTNYLLFGGLGLGLVVGLLGVAAPLAVAQNMGWPMASGFNGLAMSAPLLAGAALLGASLCAGLLVTVAVAYLLCALTPLGLSR